VLTLFQNIRPVSALYVLIFGIALRLPAWLYGSNVAYSFDPEIMKGVFTFLNQNYFLSVSLGLVIIFIQALIFNRLCINHDVIYTHSYLPAYFYMLVNSVYLQNLPVNPIMVINFCILFSFIFLFQLYQGIASTKLLYNASLFLGLASIIMPVFYFGLAFVIVGVVIFKNITIKDLLGIISGYLFPGMVAAGIYFLVGSQYHFPNLVYKLQLNFGNSLNAYLAVSIMLFASTAGLMKTFINYSKNNIKTRRITLLLIAFMAFAVLVILINLEQFRLFFPVISAGISVQMAYFLMGKKQKRLKELLNYLIVLAVIYSLYGDKFIQF
jgi:hypothetical protein